MSSKLLKVGLTGTIGSGKSEVRRIIAERDIPTLDADSLAKTIAAEDVRAINAIKKTFGPDIYDVDGTLQPRVLAARAFRNKTTIAALNEILHPMVFERTAAYADELQSKGERLLIIEAALFYESGWDAEMDFMVVVSADEALRMHRVYQRSGFSEAQINERTQYQLSDDYKRSMADYVLENNGTLEELGEQVERMLGWLQSEIILS